MPSTYSPNLRLELIGQGEQAGTWGVTTNTNLGTLIEQAISGAASIVMADANYTLSANNGAADEARSAILLVTSSVSLSATRDVICPAVTKTYTVRNATTGGQSIIVKASAGTGVAIPNGVSATVYCDGTAVRTAADIPSPFIAGMIMLWSGSVATIPSGWALCNGTSGTPDLRDRFVVGAGSSYAVGATGGENSVTLTAAQMPTHAHSFSANTGGQSANHTHDFSATTSSNGEHLHGVRVYSPDLSEFGPYVAGTSTGSLTGLQNTELVGGHQHAVSGTTGFFSADHFHAVSGNTGNTGSGTSHENRPPYYALAYIMKL